MYRATATLFSTSLCALFLFVFPDHVHAVPAFPTAEGFGATAVGGRGGQVIEVTNLNDSGTGSLRACVTASGPRTCVFRVGGTIELSSSMDVTNPYLTIAGQTAPGGGITLKTSAANNHGLFVVRPTANDTIVRYIRSRPGAGGTNGDTLDAFTINAQHVMFDHVSASWGIDENVNTWYATAQDIGFQWSIISEGLNNSIHPQGPHSKGLLMGGLNKNVTTHHDLFAHNMDRHPEIKGDPSGVLEAINNVAYNYGWRTVLVSDDNGVAKTNYIGNYTKPGPNSPSYSEINYYNANGQGVQIYVKGNIGPHRLTDTNTSFTRTNNGEWSVVSANTPDAYLTTTRFPGPAIPVADTSAQVAYDAVLADAGDSSALSCEGSWHPNRDSVDTRVVNDVKNGTGAIIDNPSQVGGWPALAAGTPCADTDHDGMPDVWEQQHFGSLSHGSATNSSSDTDHDGYTDLEEYLNGTDPGNATTLTPPPSTPTSPPNPACPKKNIGDADCDGQIKLSDYGAWRSEFYGEVTTKLADFNGDGNVTLKDHSIWRQTFFDLNGGLTPTTTPPLGLLSPTPVSAAGCERFYTADSPWNTKITNSVYHPMSDLLVNQLVLNKPVRETHLYSAPDRYAYPLYHVTSSTPLQHLLDKGTFTNGTNNGDTYVRTSGPQTIDMPIPDNAQPSPGTDGQLIIINDTSGDEWSMWQAVKTTTGWTSSSASHYNIHWSAVAKTGSGPRGGGIPYGAGLIRRCEYDQGHIDHALAFAYNYPCSQSVCAAQGFPYFISPATHSDGQGTNPHDFPEGTRLQLVATDAEISSWCGADTACTLIARALRDYGMITLDNAGGPKVYPEGNETANWGTILTNTTPNTIPLTKFKVLNF